MSEHASPAARRRSLATRWLGVGLAACLSVVTLGLAVTGRLGLYINPDSTWFAVGMAVLTLVGVAASFVLPWGAEDDHGHDHAHAHDAASEADAGHHRVGPLGRAATAVGGTVATVVVLGALALPPASLSPELAASRDVGTAPLFGGVDTVALATSGDTAEFGVGDWASVFATATDPGAFAGEQVTLTGFVGGGDGDGFALTRLVITHCVIDAQTASVPVAWADAPADGQWVTLSGTIREGADGLEIVAAEVTPIDEPAEPYEY
ncbi:TIGR03943 family putative permease subunit [Microbacterium sp. GXF7504]